MQKTIQTLKSLPPTEQTLSDLFALLLALPAPDLTLCRWIRSRAMRIPTAQGYDLARRTYLYGGAWSIDDYMIACEWNREPQARFWLPRRKVLEGQHHIASRIQAFMDDPDSLYLGLSMPPGTGKSTLIKFLQGYIAGRWPESANMYVSFSDGMVKMMHDAVRAILTDRSEYCHNEIFPHNGDPDVSAEYKTMAGFGAVMGGARAAASGIGSVFSGFLHPIQSASSLLGRFRGLLRGASGDARTANQSFSLFGNGIMKSVGRILTYRMIRSVLSGITSGVSTGITNLYHANSQFAASLDQCATSAQYLKNSLAAALSPAINAMAPVIDYVVDRVVDFINVINMLIAIMTGSSTWTKAVKTPAKFSGALDDAASSAGGANEAAQELQRTLMGFDEINKLNELSSGGGGGGSSGTSGTDYSSMFTTQQVAVDGLGGKLADIWSVFQDAWESKGQKVMDAAQNAMETLKTTASDIGTAFYNVWTDGTGQSYAESLLERFRSLMDLVNALAATFDEAWTEAGRGEGVIRAVFDRMTEVNGLIADIRDAFTNVWSNGTGKEIWGALLDIITDCNNIVTGLTSGIREAWNEAGRGDGIWQAILSPVNTILTHLRNITSATASWAAELDFGPLLESVKRLLEAIDPIVDTIGGVLEGIWNNFVLPLSQWLIESGLPAFLNGVAAALTTIGDIASKVVSSIKLLADYIGGIKLDWDALWNGGDVLTLPDIDLEAELSAIWAPDAEEKIDKLNDLDGKTLNTEVNDTLKNAPRTLRNSLVTGFGTPNVSVNNTLKNSASTLWSGWKSKWGSRQVSIGNVLATSASSLWNSWKKNWHPSPLALTARMGTDVTKFASATASSINYQLSKSKNKIKPQFASVKYSVSSTNLSSKSPVTIRPTFMARGGIIDRATLFGGNVIGEDGAEAVVPLEHHTQWLDKVADRLARKLYGGGEEDAVVIENHLYLDGEQIYEGVYRDINRRTRKSGRLPFSV